MESADAIPTHRDAHVSIASHPRKEIPTHSSQLAAPALYRTTQGIFRSCIRLGGKKSQETTQPPPSNRAFWCPRGAPKMRKGAPRPARPKTRPKACPARPGLLQCTLTRAQASTPPARRYLRASAAASQLPQVTLILHCFEEQEHDPQASTALPAPPSPLLLTRVCTAPCPPRLLSAALSPLPASSRWRSIPGACFPAGAAAAVLLLLLPPPLLSLQSGHQRAPVQSPARSHTCFVACFVHGVT